VGNAQITRCVLWMPVVSNYCTKFALDLSIVEYKVVFDLQQEIISISS